METETNKQIGLLDKYINESNNIISDIEDSHRSIQNIIDTIFLINPDLNKSESQLLSSEKPVILQKFDVTLNRLSLLRSTSIEILSQLSKL